MTARIVVKDGNGRDIAVFEEQQDPNQSGSWALVTTFCRASVSEGRWRELERLAVKAWVHHDAAAEDDEVETVVIDLTEEDVGPFDPTAIHLVPWAAG